MMGFGMFGGMFLFWIALIVLVVFAAQGLFRPYKKNDGRSEPLSAVEILEHRYARGEITSEQFKQILKDIQ